MTLERLALCFYMTGSLCFLLGSVLMMLKKGV